jgi:hypothetical protein
MTIKNHAIINLTTLLIFLSCTQEQEPPRAIPPSFSKSTFAKRNEAAFFSDSALWELRVLRNEIYARHGRTFASKELNDRFSRCDWYRPSKKYSDAMLSKAEQEAIGDIKRCESYLQELDEKNKRHYDSIKTFYKTNPQFDTTIIDFLDYTGDGKKEKCVTRITRKGGSVFVRHIIISRKDTIYNRNAPASFAPEKDLAPTYDVYNNLKTAVRLSPFKASLQFVSPDVKKHYDRKKEYRRYLAKFKGEVLLTVTSEGVGCCYFWYAPKKKFEALYCE